MFGSVVPELATTPCTACGDPFAPDSDDVVWDPYHQGDHQWTALPYHRRCAGEVLPPTEPPAGVACGICRQPLGDVSAAWTQLLGRFENPVPPKAPTELTWRLAARNPRTYVAEHLACVFQKLTGKRP